MSETTINWDNWRLFIAVARAEGLAGAAKVTGKSSATLSRRMRLLEQQTGKELFHRLSKSYKLTESGSEIYDRISAIEAELHTFDGSVAGDSSTLVKVSAGSWMTYGLCQQLELITKDVTKARVRFIAAEAVLDISRRETTIGIRNSRPTQANLVCKKIGRVQFAVYATNKSITSLVQVEQQTPSAAWSKHKILAEQKANEYSDKHQSNFFEVTSPRNALDIAYSGKARIVLPTFIGDQAKPLKRMTSTISELSHDQWLVTHPTEQYHSQVRKVIDGIYRAAKNLHRL